MFDSSFILLYQNHLRAMFRNVDERDEISNDQIVFYIIDILIDKC